MSVDVDNSANVGIGTTSPGAKLEVFGTGNSFRLDSAANGSKEILFRNVGTGTAVIKTDGDLKLFVEDAGKNILFDTNGGEKMRITSAGEVGIGITAPAGQGGLAVSTIGNGVFDNSNQLRVASFYENEGASGNANRPGIILGYDKSSTPHGIIAARTQTGSGTIPGLQFFTYNGSWGPRMTVLNTGGVGIGTTTPTYQLDVVSAGDGLLSLTGATKPAMIFKVGTAVVGGIQAQANTSLNVSAYGTSSLNLQTAGTAPRLTILTGGNVGIGTITPAAELHIMSGSASYPVDANNHLVVESSSHSYIGLGGGVGSDVGIHFGDSGASGVGRIAYKNSNNSMCFRTAGGGDHLVINSSGNVGIGVTNPGTNRLQVTKAASGPVAKFNNTSGTGGTGLEVNGGNNTGFALKIGDYNGAFKMIVQGNGNVGIGATTPATQLEIFNENDNPATLRLSSDLTDEDLVGAIISFSNDAGGGGVQGRIENVSTDNDSTIFKFYTDNTSSPSMTLFDSGNMTIAGTLTQNSDVRLKENIKPIESALDKVKQMQGVEFNKINSSTKEIGVVAQEIEKIIPELVLEDKEGIKSVAYGNITAVLIEAIKEQQKQIEELKQQLNK